MILQLYEILSGRIIVNARLYFNFKKKSDRRYCIRIKKFVYYDRGKIIQIGFLINDIANKMPMNHFKLIEENKNGPRNLEVTSKRQSFGSW